MNNIHSTLLGKSLAERQVRIQTGCSVIAINRDGTMINNPDPTIRFQERDELIMIGTDDAEKQLIKNIPRPSCLR
ncbi:MAG: TrkA C-terminal domain-containing protein [Desulfobacterales bacterium]|nr:TrkA C-terminal domain-containing protein [Desulfobacterales bacterium]